ncbi:uncharacterized protein LOC132706527 isoform X1 [Cylas formicarius]|uniref:uncharacterized protein LOC132706527 isoform X1 n=1 Tax=Cylas formicarius TaxID=197179 RepID=UPI0029589BB6|nr:uncharacterized protein LOC132706527 isoform X1 [Cylas formicarius]
MLKSTQGAPKLLTHSEISKRITSKSRQQQPFSELADEEGRYRNVASYDSRKKQFLAAAKRYNRMNWEILAACRPRLDDDYESLLGLNFLDRSREDANGQLCESSSPCPESEPNLTGQRLRRRVRRELQQEETSIYTACLTEPWFRRQLILNKFIQAGRMVILKNRLIKNLEILKKLNRDKWDMELVAK